MEDNIFSCIFIALGFSGTMFLLNFIMLLTEKERYIGSMSMLILNYLIGCSGSIILGYILREKKSQTINISNDKDNNKEE